VLAYAAVSADYFLEIESHFATRRGTPFILSAKDWVLMKKWHEEGVPLPVVLEAIDSVFDKNETATGRKKMINGLSYCRHAVKELWDERRELHVGGEGQAPEAGAEPLLEALAVDLEASEAPHEVVAAFAVRVRGLAAEKTIPRIEEQLIDLEAELFAAVFAALPTSEMEAVRVAVVRALGDTSRLDEKTRVRTEEANLRRIVRDRFGLPRLTLFR
jgi:hypothetical protein